MNEQILIQGKAITHRKVFHYFWLPVSIWLLTMLYALSLYKRNVNNCRYYIVPDSCFPEWNYSFWEFLKMSMGANTFFVSLTVLLFCCVFCLLAGAFLYLAFRNCEITVTDRRIYGRAAFGVQVQLSLSALVEAVESPGHCVQLRLYTGSLIFGGIQNYKEVCRMIEEAIPLQAPQDKKRVQIGSRGVSSSKLAAVCFLPLALIVLVLLLTGGPSLGAAWESYWNTEAYRNQFYFLEFWLACMMEAQGNWPECLIYLIYPALLAGGISYFACSRQKILVTADSVQGRGAFRAAFHIPLSHITKAEPGWLHSLALYHTQGKIRIAGIKNREEVLRILKNSTNPIQESPPKAEADTLKAKIQSHPMAAVICALPALAFFLLLLAALSQNDVIYREVFRRSAYMQEAHFYLEYLLLRTLSNGLGRWIKRLFFLALLGIYVFSASCSSQLTLGKGKISGHSRFGGFLDTEADSVVGISMSALGKMTLYTSSETFIFEGVKNRKNFFDYFGEKFANPAQTEID